MSRTEGFSDRTYDNFILSLTKSTLSQLGDLTKSRSQKKYRSEDNAIFQKKSIITSHRDEKLPDIYKKLLENDVLSCPVLRQGELFYGMIDLLDIIKFIIDECGKKNLKNVDSLFSIEEFKNTTVAHIMEYPYSSKSKKFQKLSPGSTIFSAFEILSKEANRIAVVDEKGEILDLITQFDLVHWVYDNMDKLGEKRNQKLKDFGSANQYVMSILEHEEVIDAFRLIKIVGVGGVAVIQENGTLVGNISARDIKKLGKNGEQFHRLFSPVKEFVDTDPIVCTEEDTLEDVIELLVTKNIHRVYIVDIDFNTVGVITLRDIIGELLPINQQAHITLESINELTNRIDESGFEEKVESPVHHFKHKKHSATSSTSTTSKIGKPAQ
eukprot:gene12289-15025_t